MSDPEQGYQVLARKYRPATFADLIGQEAMVRTLKNAFAADRIAHAFVMTGVRGVGKTTTARIIAKGLNCIGPAGKGGPTTEPCGVSDHCKAIAEGRHVDVMEMDAASRTGVGDIREIIDSVHYRAASARYLLGVILQMTMVMMTSMALTREIERGTMENLLAMPVTPPEVMLGKVLPYFAVGAVQVAVVLSVAKLVFGVPFEGSLTLLLAGVGLFILALVILGYLISTLARTQMQAMQLTFFYFLPSLLLSGFMFPFPGMPGWAQLLGEALPLTHFLRLIRSIMLKGAEPQAVAPHMAALALFVGVLAILALTRFRKTLD